MPRLSHEERRLLIASAGRVQACVDQLVGQDVFIEAGGIIGMSIDPKEIRKKVLNLLQGELDVVFRLAEIHSPSADADGSEWLLRQLRP